MRPPVTVDLPDEVEAYLRVAGYDRERLSHELRPSLAVSLFARKVLSLGAAAEVADMSLWDFIPLLGAHGIPVADYDQEEWREELETARWLAHKTGK